MRRVSVADEEPELGDPFAEVHQEVAGGLGCPGRSRVRGHAEDVDSPGVDLHHEQDVESAQADGVQVEEVSASSPAAWVRRKVR
jgi:hypothetical protein